MLALTATANAVNAQKPGVVISLRAEANIEGRTYTLGDIAHLEGADENQVSRLKRVLIGKTPRAGVSARVSREAIAMRINRLLPGLSKKVTWTGTHLSLVQGSHHRFDKKTYVSSAQKHLNDWLGKLYDNYAIAPVGKYDDLQLPSGKVSLEAEIAKRDRVKKRMCVWIDLLVDDQQYNTVPVWFDVTVKTEVLELRHDFSAGDRLVQGMLHKQEHDLTTVSGTPVTDITILEGQRLIRDLPMGTVLTEEVIQPIPAVIKGQKVLVKTSVGNVTLTVRARALEDGNEGDPVRVERLDGRDSYMARVLGNGFAVVGGDIYE
ncbi:MAG: flagellar basal body P-ring formation chaperone FlgA [Candidatus Thiodiazotropha sp. L084R]